MHNLNVTLENGDTISCPSGTQVGSLAPARPADELPYIAALVNNDLASMSYPLNVNCSVRFLTAADSHGWRIYRRSLCYLLAKTVREVFPEAVFSVEHSFGQGIYCSFFASEKESNGITGDQLARIDTAMRELVERDLPIERRKIAFTEAVREFETSGQTDKLNLLKYRNPPRIVIHCCDGFTDLAHGPLAPATGQLSCFKLIHYAPGFILQLPERADPREIGTFQDQPHLFRIFQEHKAWGRVLGVSTAGRLNEITAGGEIKRFIRIAEALHEKKVAHIADQIHAARDQVRLVLVAGPSCAGKTTFAKRLATHLTVNGLPCPVTVSTDDYFVGPEHNPLDENGKPDYEHIEAVDLDLFNTDLLKLIEGGEIDVPVFNFVEKRREHRDRKLRIGPGQMVIIEGIHGLNPRLTAALPDDCSFKIYVSALTQLSVDSNNRLSTTDNRLMRRIVRDHRFRGHSALDSLRLWPSVRRGEKRWIFPFQREADATFNSALDYEFAVLKPLLEPLLMQVKPDNPEYAEARRLSEFLLSFLGTDDRSVPPLSILREYIGGSSYEY